MKVQVDPMDPRGAGMVQTLGRDGNGNVTTITKTGGGLTFVQTLAWEADPVNGGYRLTSVSEWVPQ